MYMISKRARLVRQHLKEDCDQEPHRLETAGVKLLDRGTYDLIACRGTRKEVELYWGEASEFAANTRSTEKLRSTLPGLLGLFLMIVSPRCIRPDITLGHVEIAS